MSRSLCLKEADGNTSFFHRKSKSRKTRNKVKEISRKGFPKICSFLEIKIEAFSFKNIYLEDIVIDLYVEVFFIYCIPSIVFNMENYQLVKSIKEDEVT